jgi:hypothetical protein
MTLYGSLIVYSADTFYVMAFWNIENIDFDSSFVAFFIYCES